MVWLLLTVLLSLALWATGRTAGRVFGRWGARWGAWVLAVVLGLFYLSAVMAVADALMPSQQPEWLPTAGKLLVLLTVSAHWNAAENKDAEESGHQPDQPNQPEADPGASD